MKVANHKRLQGLQENFISHMVQMKANRFLLHDK